MISLKKKYYSSKRRFRWFYHIPLLVILLPSILLVSYTFFLSSIKNEPELRKNLRVNLLLLTLCPTGSLSQKFKDVPVLEQSAALTNFPTESPTNGFIEPLPRLEFVHITKTGGSAIEKAGAYHGIIWGACHYMNISDVGCYGANLPYTAPNYQSYALTSPWHSPPKILKKKVNSSLYPYEGAELFTVVRNPYDRAVSEYYCPWVGYKGEDKNDPDIMNEWIKNMTKRVEKLLFEYNSKNSNDVPKSQYLELNEDPWYLAQKHYINQVEYVYDGDKQIIKHIVHYEKFSEEFGKVMKKYNLNILLPDKKADGVYTSDEVKLRYIDLYPETIAVINKYAAQDFEKFGYEMVNNFDKVSTIVVV